jgi:serine/threonine protein phosphatase 1
MQRTYAIGDIHGCLRQLEALVAQCVAEAAGARIRFVFLGDYIDRGPDSLGVIAFLMALQAHAAADVVCLSGNHEELALAALSGGDNLSQWLRNGGDKTLRSYGVAAPGDMPPDHMAWLRSLSLSYDDGLRFFVHAGVDPSRPLDRQSDDDMRWIREPFLSDLRDYGRLVVHGHTPRKDGAPDQKPNRLNLDTAAVLGGPLTAAIFDDQTKAPLGFLQTV